MKLLGLVVGCVLAGVSCFAGSVQAAAPVCPPELQAAVDNSNNKRLVQRYYKKWQDQVPAVNKAIMQGLLKLDAEGKLRHMSRQELMELNLLPPNKKLIQTIAAKYDIPYSKKSKGNDIFYGLNGRAIYPPNDGFIGAPRTVELSDASQLIDRYGSPRGRFFTYYGYDLGSRAMTKYDAAGVANGKMPYHIYRVNKPIEKVKLGVAAPWFGEKGGCIQGMLPKSLSFYIGEENGNYLVEVPKPAS